VAEYFKILQITVNLVRGILQIKKELQLEVLFYMIFIKNYANKPAIVAESSDAIVATSNSFKPKPLTSFAFAPLIA